MTTRLPSWLTLGGLVSVSMFWGLGPPASSPSGEPIHAVGVPDAARACQLALGDAPRQGPGARNPDSAKTCAQCHPAFYKEWDGRGHSQAWVDKHYQDSLKGKKKPQLCHGCHIPAEVHARLGRKPKVRSDLLEEGVTCVSCHKSEGKILGPFGAKTDAHPSQKHSSFIMPDSDKLCASCHSTKIAPVLPVARDHKQYRKQLGEAAKGCVECHMPEIERHLAVSMVTGKPVGPKRKTRSHVVLGPNDIEFCATAFDLGAEVGGKDLVVSVENKAGHRVPGLKLRRFAIAVIQLDAKGAELGSDEISLTHENVIKACEKRPFPFTLRKGASQVRLRVDHLFQEKKVATILTKTIKL